MSAVCYIFDLQSGPICFDCLMLNSSRNVSVDSLIPRHAIFYNRRTSYKIFHGKRILLLLFPKVYVVSVSL